MADPKLTLYHYWRSTSSWRVRWALDHKGLRAELVFVNLLANESELPEHLARNPMGYVPVLEIGSGPRPRYLSESFAIIEWLDETHSEKPLLPADPFARARARQLAELINSGTQPLQNLGVAERHSQDPAEKKAWQQHWIRKGLHAYETLVRETAGKYSMGDAFTLADIFLVPQCYSAARNEIPIGDFPTIAKIHESVSRLESYASSHPDRYKPAS